MKRRFRLTSTADFERVRRFGKSYAHPLVVLVAYPNQMDKVRIAVSAGRSLGKAVRRNKAKRTLREAIRPLIPHITTGWDLVFLARKPMASAKFSDLGDAITSLLSQADLLEETP